MKNKIKIFGLLIVGFLGFAGFCNASDVTPIFSENFNSYSLGQLIGQGDWTGNIGSVFIVDNNDCLEGLCIKKINNYSGAFFITRTGASQTSMIMTFYFKLGRSTCSSNCQYAGLPFMTLGVTGAPNWWGFYEDSNGGVVDAYGKMLGAMGDNIWTKFVVTTFYDNGSVKISVNIDDHGPSVLEDTQLPYINTVSFSDGLIDFSQWRADFIGYGENLAPTKNPVLFIPGIMGSRLYEGENLLWEPFSDSDIKKLYLDENGKSVREDIYTKDIIDEVPVTGGNIYESILNDFKEKRNSGDISDYATVPYDWRLSLSDIVKGDKEESTGAIYYTRATSIPYIEKALRDIAATSSTRKVTIIAHSNGGLLVKALINQLGEEASNLIDQLIFIAVPQLGTPQAIGALLHGYETGIPHDWLPLILSSSRARDFARNTPMIYQLLPHTDYYQNAGTTISNTYAYDAGGQRVKLTNGVGTIYYPTKFYNIDSNAQNPTPITKHVFAGDLNIATIQGAGADAQIYYNATDLLNSSSVMTDSAGAIAETMDYFPFGGIRIDEKSSTFNEQRKYIGQEYDNDTGLNYLNARYYDPKRGQFISQDPMFWALPSELLSDPQQLNSYNYARNNPIVGSDPTGLLVELMSRTVFDVKGHDVGIHTFFKITPDHPSEINIQGLPKGTKEFTFGAYNSDSKWITNTLSKQIGTKENSGDKNWAFEGGKIINGTTIKPPGEQTDTDLINNMGKAYNDMNLNEVRYFGLGNIHGLYNANSNNFTYTLGVKSGVKDQMDTFVPNPGKATLGGAPGYGREVPTTSIYRTVRDRVYSIRNKVNQFISSLKEKR